MDEIGKVQTLDSFITNEQGSIKWSVISAIGLFVIGFAASTFIYWLSSSSETAAANAEAKTSVEAIVKYIAAIPVLAGALISGFPVKEYYAKKNRINTFKCLRNAYEKPPVSEEIDKRFWTLLDKNLG